MERLSEVGQDLFVWEQLNKRKGTFLDIGSGNPILNNNSYALELAGWRGLLIDIDPQWCELSMNHRNSPFYPLDALKVDWKALIASQNLPFQIDYLSLDVDDHPDYEPESKTFRVLQNIFDAGLTFSAITVEHDAYRCGEEPRASIRKYLEARDYCLFRPDVPYDSARPKETAFEDWFLHLRARH